MKKASLLLKRGFVVLDTMESSFRGRFRKALRNAPGILQYKTLKQINLIQRISAALDATQIVYYFGGGFAHDGKRGKLTRRHYDIDIVLFEDSLQKAQTALENDGFEVHQKTPYQSVAKKGGLHADIFNWKDIDGQWIQFMLYNNMVRIPRSLLLTGQTCKLLGVTYKIPSNEFLVSLLPFIKRSAEDKKYIASLPTSQSMQFFKKHECVRVPMDITIYELELNENSETYGSVASSIEPAPMVP